MVGCVLSAILIMMGWRRLMWDGWEMSYVGCKLLRLLLLIKM